MLPYLVLTPSLRVSTWGLLVALACVAVLWLGRVNALERGLKPELMERLWPWLILGGFAGAHLYSLVAISGWPVRPLPLAEVLNIFRGTAVQGGIIGGAGAAALFLRREGVSVLSVCDALAPGGALAQGVARLGCFAAGCCYGRPTSLFFGVIFTSPWADPDAPRGVPLHPAQLYEVALDVGLAVLLQRRLRVREAPGVVFAVYIMGAGLIRFFVQFFRGDDSRRLLGLAPPQLMALALCAAAAALYQRTRAVVRT